MGLAPEEIENYKKLNFPSFFPDPELPSLLLDQFFRDALQTCQVDT
jgi:hypothetical protein